MYNRYNPHTTVYYDSDGELYHHGILGQKWGVRRYQNEDGTLTEEGKIRYAAGNSKNGIVNPTYNSDTMKAVTKDLERKIGNTPQMIKAKGKAVATYILGSVATAAIAIASSAINPAAGTGAIIGGKMGIYKGIQNVMDKGREEAAMALGYSDFGDMKIQEFNKRAKAAGMPSMQEQMKAVEEEMYKRNSKR